MGNTSSYPYYHTRPECFPDIYCKNWMKDVPDEVSLSELTIPGTHSSHSLKGSDYYTTQSWSLLTQLEAGIRFLDFEFYEADGELQVYHHSKSQSTTIIKCLDTVVKFLKLQCTETVMIRLSHWDYSEKRHSPNLERTILENTHIWKPPPGEVQIPSMGEVRGKIVIFQNMAGTIIGIPKHFMASVENDMQVSTLFSISSKWNKVKNHIELAKYCSKGRLYLTFACGAGSGAYPYSVAYRINYYLYEYLKDTSEDKTKLGIVALDYPGCDLIELLVKRNFHEMGREHDPY